ncbi:MAG: hypothetical protein ACJA0N_001076 [Pseudohongiellaceae bacterium]|jgi:hypothetical protein
MNILKKTLLAAALVVPTAANAHLVGVGYTAETNGDVTFFGQTYHGNAANPLGETTGLTIGGTLYSWDGVLHGTTQAPSDLDVYFPIMNRSFDAWFTLTVSGLTDGVTSIAGSTAELNDYWDGSTSFNIDVIEASEPSSLALLGLGLAGLGFARKKRSA